MLPATAAPAGRRFETKSMRLLINGVEIHMTGGLEWSHRELYGVQDLGTSSRAFPSKVVIVGTCYPVPGSPSIFGRRETAAEHHERTLASLRRRADAWRAEYNVDPGPDAPDVE